MYTEQSTWSQAQGWSFPEKEWNAPVQLVFVFGSRHIIRRQGQFEPLRKRYPEAYFIGCSTAGEIYGDQVLDDSIVATAVHFEHTKVQGVSAQIASMEDSFAMGQQLAEGLPTEQLQHVFVLSDGLHVNGSELVEGLYSKLPKGVAVTGGLSGDNDTFEETYVLYQEKILQKQVLAVGIYGHRIRIGYGSQGGWHPFGPERLITEANRNILFEMDGKSALELYKMYLGHHAKNLPSTGLLFPLSVRKKLRERPIVRTILAVDEENQSMTFAGDLPMRGYARLMRANTDSLIDGAEAAAQTSLLPLKNKPPELAILISCVGRKLVMKQRVEEEVEAIREILGKQTTLAGFYSYGEIAPFEGGTCSRLHNQTMTITTFTEL